MFWFVRIFAVFIVLLATAELLLSALFFYAADYAYGVFMLAFSIAAGMNILFFRLWFRVYSR